MRRISILGTVLVLVLVTTAMAAENYPLYSLENVNLYEVTPDTGKLCTIEHTDAGNVFVCRVMATGEILLNIPLEKPEPYLMNTVIIGDEIFVFHVVIIDREKRELETIIFKINTSDGHITDLYKSGEMLGFAERFYVTENGLLLTEKRGNSPFFFSFDTNKITAIDLEDDFRIRSFDLAHNSAVIIRQSNFSTKFKGDDDKSTYTEGDGNALEVYLCDFSDDFKLTKVGLYQPSYVISKNADETSLPHFTIDNSDYDWVGPSFWANRFPLSPGEMVGDTIRHGVMESLVGFESLSELSFVGDHYVVAKKYSDSFEISLVVYSLDNPRKNKVETVSRKDRDGITKLLMKNTVTEKRLLDLEVISQVFAARFYEIKLVTTEVDSSDGDMYTMTSTESFTAVGMDGVYSVLKQNEQLVPLVAGDFVLNETSAPEFQRALDALFPVGRFDEKHKTFHKKNDQWLFVRDESFGKKEGIVVTVDGAGNILGIGSKGVISED